MSPEVAGLTILALGNGAPDVSSTIVACTYSHVMYDVLYRGFTHTVEYQTALGQQFNMGIGELLGAGLFVTSCVVAAVAFAAPNAKLDRHSFLRDVSFYLVAVVAVFFICWDGHIYIYESIGFLVYYTGYVLFAVLVHYCGKKKTTDLNESSVSIPEAGALFSQLQFYHN
jgi:sodium/potassium/calcium exchanger 6